MKDNTIVGHVPSDLAPRLSQYLKIEVSTAFAEVRERKKTV